MSKKTYVDLERSEKMLMFAKKESRRWEKIESECYGKLSKERTIARKQKREQKYNYWG